jgi:hypothetical protein
MAKPQISAPQDENAFPKKYTPRGATFSFEGGVFEQNTVQGQTGVPVQDRGGGSTVEVWPLGFRVGRGLFRPEG